MGHASGRDEVGTKHGDECRLDDGNESRCDSGGNFDASDKALLRMHYPAVEQSSNWTMVVVHGAAACSKDDGHDEAVRASPAQLPERVPGNEQGGQQRTSRVR
nr:hypothetical protein CFP56_21772 [Quercus suber]